MPTRGQTVLCWSRERGDGLSAWPSVVHSGGTAESPGVVGADVFPGRYQRGHDVDAGTRSTR